MSDDIRIGDLYKKFNDFELDHISFSLPKGNIMGFVGPNGSGKTTTIKLMLNMLKKDNGEIEIFGLDNVLNEKEIKEKLGVVFDSHYFADEWNLKEVENSLCMFYANWDSRIYSSWLQRFHLLPDKKVSELSKGMQMKLMLACAFSHHAEMLVLDEPTSGLDSVSRDELLDVLLDFTSDQEHSVLFSTHITSDLEKVADYITFIYDGRILYTGRKEDFIDSYRIIRSKDEEISEGIKETLVGFRNVADRFEGLIRIEDLQKFPQLETEPASIDDIIIFTNKGMTQL